MPPRINAIATAVPIHEIDRAAAERVAAKVFGADTDRLGPIFANAGIDRRHSCVPEAWYLSAHSWHERAELFARHALDLAARASLDCLIRARLPLSAVDAVVAVSTTGFPTPSLDALLAERLGLRADVIRLPIFGLGCAGGASGLARAAALARAYPGIRVLLVVVELCGLTFRPHDRSPANMVATALFGDGCAAALLSTRGDGPAIVAGGEHRWPGSLDVMGWNIEDDGLGIRFSRDIPSLVETELRPVVDEWLARQGLARSRIDRFLCHPGGAKVVLALEDALGLPEGALAVERQVMKDHGNMSAASLMFVLERAMASALPRRSLALALGPGFTASFLLLEGP